MRANNHPQKPADMPCRIVETTVLNDAVKPTLDGCGYHCDRCGFNPGEADRRLRNGRWEIIYERNNVLTGEPVSMPGGVRRLVFTRKEEENGD